MSRILRVLILLALAGILAATAYMFRQLSHPPGGGQRRLPELSLELQPAEAAPGERVTVICRIRNPHDVSLYLNDPPQGLFQRRDRGAQIDLEQYFRAETLKDPRRNPLIRHGGVPRAVELPPGASQVRRFALDLEFDAEGSREIRFLLGCSDEPRSRYLVDGAAYELPDLVERFLDWQVQAVSPPARLVIRRRPPAQATEASPGVPAEEIQAALTAMVSEAVRLRQSGQLGAAEEVLLRAQALALARLKPLHPVHAVLHSNLGILYTMAGKVEEAENHFTRAQRVSLHALGPQHPETARISLNLAAFVLTRGRTEEARLLLEGTRAALGDLETRETELEAFYQAAGEALEKIK